MRGSTHGHPDPPSHSPPAPTSASALTRVLVTGGSGYIGRRLVERLSQAGVAVTNLDLAGPLPGLPDVRTAQVWVRADIRHPPADLGSFDVVVHAAGLAGDGSAGDGTASHGTAPHGTARHGSIDAVHDVNVVGTRSVLQMAADHRTSSGGTPRVVLLSSIAVLGPSELPLDEFAPLGPVSAYGQSKADAELAARDVAGDHGIDLVIVRPGYVFGADHPGNFGRMVSAIRRGRLVLPGRDDTIKAGIYRPDLISLLHDLSLQVDPPAVVNAVYPDTPTVLAWARDLQTRIRPDSRVRTIPELLSRAGIAGLHRVGELARQPRLIALASTADKLRRSSNVVSQIVGGPDRPFDHDWYRAASLLFGGHPYPLADR